MNEVQELSYGASIALIFGGAALLILALELYDIIRNKRCVKCGKLLKPSTILLDTEEKCMSCIVED